LFGLSGHLHLDDRLAPRLCDYGLAVLYSHDLASDPILVSHRHIISSPDACQMSESHPVSQAPGTNAPSRDG
jgi:hypothetical protein